MTELSLKSINLFLKSANIVSKVSKIFFSCAIFAAVKENKAVE